MKMNGCLDLVILVFAIATIRAKEPELPLCPTNMAFFPQTLPMHCRMSPNGITGPPPFPPEFYHSPSPDKVPNPIPFPIAPGIPGFPPGLPPMPLGMPGPGLPPGMPGPGLPPGMPGPGPMPMPMPIPMPAPGPHHKLPVIVMPFYSPDPNYKKRKAGHHSAKSDDFDIDIYTRRPPWYDSDAEPAHVMEVRPKRPFHIKPSDVGYTFKKVVNGKVVKYIPSRRDNDYSSDADDMSSEHGWDGRRRFKNGRRKNRRHKSRRQRYNRKDLLTPILQYVTKDGYVIYEKKISKDEAKDWLSMRKEGVKQAEPEEVDAPNDDRNDDYIEPNELNKDVELLDEAKDKSKEKVESQTQKTPKKHFPHKIKKHHTKEGKNPALVTA